MSIFCHFITFHKSSKVNFTNKILNQFHPSPNTSKMDFRELALKYIYYVLLYLNKENPKPNQTFSPFNIQVFTPSNHIASPALVSHKPSTLIKRMNL